LLGSGIGIVSGQICYERAYAQVQANSQSIQGDVGGYLCSAGKLPVLFGVLGVVGGAVVGLSGSLMVWLWSLKSNSKTA
jgi:hypothetical protein